MPEAVRLQLSSLLFDERLNDPETVKALVEDAAISVDTMSARRAAWIH